MLQVGVYLGIAYCIFGGSLVIAAGVIQRGCAALLASHYITGQPGLAKRVVEFRDTLQVSNKAGILHYSFITPTILDTDPLFARHSSTTELIALTVPCHCQRFKGL